MAYTVNFNKNNIKRNITKVSDKGQEILSQQVLKDSNVYARLDSGEMIASSLRASNFKDGVLVWDTPYAKRVYYTGTPSKDVNSNASRLWFEVAKKKKLKTWVKVLDNIIKKGV